MLKQIASYILPHCILIDYDPEQNMRTPEQVDIEAINQSAPYVYAQVHGGTAAGIVAQLNTLSDLSSHILAPLKDKPHIQEIQITHKDGNKRHGVKELLRMINVDGRQAMAIGDGDNDLPLFEEADLRIAMGNASERLKAAADHIVADVSEDGFAEAMERFVLH
jgi:hydroxymethylpyrimidine pyrophosphatase-like HAD family hydrolase